MKKITKVLIIALIAVMLFGTVYSSAAEPYDTYTYSIEGETVKSPPAYSAVDDFDSIDMNIPQISSVGALSANVTDIFSDDQANIYLADKGNNRIVVLNKFYEATAIIESYVDENGVAQTFSGPSGLYVTDASKTTDNSSYIYICDTGNKRIVVFDREYNYVRTINKPSDDIIKEAAFDPTAIAVDIYGRIFIVSPSAYEGVIVLTADGGFTGFIGAQEASTSLIDKIWARFQSAEDRLTQKKELPTAYNNITVDDDGFVYVTMYPIDPEEQRNQLSSIRSKKATYSPVKKLNSQGKEIMNRNGFFDPGGEVVINVADISQIKDVALGAEGTWTILDQSRSRFYTYDQTGNLLFAFGGKGDQLGHGATFTGMTYQIVDGAYRIVAVDKAASDSKITVYDPTPYYNALIKAISNENDHDYISAQDSWERVLTLNNNLDLAYIGIGKALYNQGKYAESMEYLESAYETKVWSDAHASANKNIISKWLFPIIILVIIALVLVFKFLGYAKKKNKATSLKVGKKTYWEELLYSFHLVFHPFDGFWDLKHEKRGSVRAASTIIAITIAAFFYNSIGKGYAFNPRGETTNILVVVAGVCLVLFLFEISNWCLTTLFEGEGSFKDIYIAVGYSLAPLPLFLVASTVLTNFMTTSSQSMINLIVTIGYVWVGILLYFGTLVTHDYSLKKNIVTIFGTIVAMLVIAFIAVLFFSLVAKMVTFILSIFTEIGNRT